VSGSSVCGLDRSLALAKKQGAVIAFMHPAFHPWPYRDDTVYLFARRDLVNESWERGARA
jgi:hypothetical protein